jgi:choline dehydrogenase-like flavoprotein
MSRHVVVIGSGAGGSAAAWVLAQAGFEVTILEKGQNYFRGLDDPAGLALPLFGGDEIRKRRGFPGMDAFAEPRSLRSQGEAESGAPRSYSGDVNMLPGTVGGGTTHWDAKVPRFFRMDFAMRSRFGPVKGADVADWPLSYDELAPWYDEAERVLGVAGDLAETPDFVLAESPRGVFDAARPAHNALSSSGGGNFGYRVPFPRRSTAPDTAAATTAATARATAARSTHAAARPCPFCAARCWPARSW